MLEAFELREDRWMVPATLADDAPVSQPPFDAITFPLDTLWPEGTPASDCETQSTNVSMKRSVSL